MNKPSLRVAVVGSGLAGLTTAYLLRREGVEVYLIERVCPTSCLLEESDLLMGDDSRINWDSTLRLLRSLLHPTPSSAERRHANPGRTGMESRDGQWMYPCVHSKVVRLISHANFTSS